MRRLATPLLFLALACGIYLLGSFTGPSLFRSIWPNSPSNSPIVRIPNPSGLGRIHPKDDILNLGGIPGDRIKTIFVTINKEVKKGDNLVEFASRDERKREWELALSQLKSANDRLAAMMIVKQKKLADLRVQGIKVSSAAELKLRLEEIQIPSVRAGAKYAVDLLRSLRSLDPARANVVEQDLQKAVVEAEGAKSRLEAALVSRDAVRSQLKLDQEAIERAKELFEAESELSRISLSLPVLKEQADLAALRYRRALLVAESDGRVLRVLAREGSTVGQEPILQMTTSSDVVVIAEVQVDTIEVLNKWLASKKPIRAVMKARGLPGILRGVVSSPNDVAPIVARNSLPGFSPRAEVDRSIIEVRIDLDKESSSKTAKFIGAEVNVDFLDPNQPSSDE